VISKEKIHECVHMFMCTDRKRRKCFESKVKELGIHHTQHRVLMHISRCDGAVNQKQIAEKFDVSPAAVAGVIKKLENGGYISRQTLESDNRYNEVKITQKDKQMIDDTRSIFDELDKQTFKYFSDDDIDEFMLLLEKMKKALSEEREWAKWKDGLSM